MSKPTGPPYYDTLERLRELYAKGRITLAEFERRVEVVLRDAA